MRSLGEIESVDGFDRCLDCPPHVQARSAYTLTGVPVIGNEADVLGDVLADLSRDVGSSDGWTTAGFHASVRAAALDAGHRAFTL